jgi:hypothetical protein
MGLRGHWLFSKHLFAATMFLPSCIGVLKAPPLALFQATRESATSTWLFSKPQAALQLKMAAGLSKKYIPRKSQIELKKVTKKSILFEKQQRSRFNPD